MCKITNFNFDNKDVRTLLINEKPYFVGCDVAEVLGYAKPNNAISTHCKGALKQGILTEGEKQEMLVIPEGDVFRLIIKSRLEKAQKFESLVMDEILPSLRKTGKYETTPILSKPISLPKPKLNTIDLSNFTSYQYFHINDPILSFPYFRFKINQETNMPLINLQDYMNCINWKDYRSMGMQWSLEQAGINTRDKDNYRYSETLPFNIVYKREVEDKDNNERIVNKTMYEYLEQFRQSFKKASDLKLLQELNHNIQLIETEEDYNKTPAIQNYINLIGNEPLLTASQVGAVLGISALKVGKMANQLNLKYEKYGQWFKDKAQHSIKEVQTFRYNKNIIQALKEYLGIDDVKLISNS